MRKSRIFRTGSLLSGFLFLIAASELFESQMQRVEYPAPRFPSYLKKPGSVQEVLPYARAIVRNKNSMQGSGMGLLSRGDNILLVAQAQSEDLILEALVEALKERGISAQILYDFDMVGVSREDALEVRRIRRNYTAEKGYMGAASWILRNFPDSDRARAWLEKENPSLYGKLFPKNQDPSQHLQEVDEKLDNDVIGTGIKDYLTKNPEIRGVYWGKGGSTGLRRALYPMPEKFLGILWMDNRWEVMSEIGSYPGDVWQLTEEKSLETLAYAAEIDAKDPEGTDMTCDISEIQAERWAQGSYQRGHLYMFPNQATGRFGYSIVDYPAFQESWLPREPIAKPEGVIAATGGSGFFPRWEVHFKDGYITEVKGGGIWGDALRQFMKYPGLADLTYPYHNNPGFWYLYENAWGTHPKYFRNPKYMYEGSLGPERMRSGVIHWGLGIRVRHGPEDQGPSLEWQKFTTAHNVPVDHGFHSYTHFTTYQIRIRGANRWVKLLDKGRMVSLDDPESRALASRYGNPDRILAEDWIPYKPGINGPGSYEEFSKNPWQTAKGVIERVEAGTYEYFYPGR